MGCRVLVEFWRWGWGCCICFYDFCGGKAGGTVGVTCILYSIGFLNWILLGAYSVRRNGVVNILYSYSGTGAYSVTGARKDKLVGPMINSIVDEFSNDCTNLGCL
jgi:hypothetical protein